MTAMASQNGSEFNPPMNGAILGSIIFHALVILLAVFGLPFVHKPPVIVDDPISVEVIDVSEFRQTDRAPVKAPLPPEPKEEEKPPEKKVEKPPTPPKVDVKEPPKAVPPKPPEPKKEEVKKAEAPKPPPPEALKPPEPKPPEPKKEEVKEETQQQDFASLLKNLQESEQQVETPTVNPQAQNTPPQPAPQAMLGERMSMSEMDALRRQLSQCWSIQAGARYAEDLVVEVRLLVNRDRTVRSATIVDQGRYNRDGFFRAAADSALRAVRSPMCNPLHLPEGKYDLWKDMVATFDPRDML